MGVVGQPAREETAQGATVVTVEQAQPVLLVAHLPTMQAEVEAQLAPELAAQIPLGEDRVERGKSDQQLPEALEQQTLAVVVVVVA